MGAALSALPVPRASRHLESGMEDWAATNSIININRRAVDTNERNAEGRRQLRVSVVPHFITKLQHGYGYRDNIAHGYGDYNHGCCGCYGLRQLKGGKNRYLILMLLFRALPMVAMATATMAATPAMRLLVEACPDPIQIPSRPR